MIVNCKVCKKPLGDKDPITKAIVEYFGTGAAHESCLKEAAPQSDTKDTNA